MYIYIYIYIDTCIYTYIYIDTYIYMYMYICIYVISIFTCMYIYIHIYIHIHIHIHTSRSLACSLARSLWLACSRASRLISWLHLSYYRKHLECDLGCCITIKTHGFFADYRALLQIIGLFGACTREMQCVAVIPQLKSHTKMFSILVRVYTRVCVFVRVCVWVYVWVRELLCEHVCSVTLRGGGLGSSTILKHLMSPTPRRKWYSTTGRRAH